MKQVGLVLLIIAALVVSAHFYGRLVRGTFEVIYAPRDDTAMRGERLLVKETGGGRGVIYEIPYAESFHATGELYGYLRLGNFKVDTNAVLFETILEIGTASNDTAHLTGETKTIKRYRYNTRTKTLQELPSENS